MLSMQWREARAGLLRMHAAGWFPSCRGAQKSTKCPRRTSERSRSSPNPTADDQNPTIELAQDEADRIPIGLGVPRSRICSNDVPLSQEAPSEDHGEAATWSNHGNKGS